jgi:hypothetical protein
MGQLTSTDFTDGPVNLHSPTEAKRNPASNSSSKDTSAQGEPSSTTTDGEAAVDTLATAAFGHLQESNIGHFGNHGQYASFYFCGPNYI